MEINTSMRNRLPNPISSSILTRSAEETGRDLIRDEFVASSTDWAPPPRSAVSPQIAPASQSKKPSLEAVHARVLRYDQHIVAAAAKYKVDPNLIRGVIAQESKGLPDAGSHKGARGLMQLMPKTARSLGVSDLSDVGQNVMAGTRYLSRLLSQYDGNVAKALWAYNAGPGNLAKGIKPAETQNYIPKVLEFASQFQALLR